MYQSWTSRSYSFLYSVSRFFLEFKVYTHQIRLKWTFRTKSICFLWPHTWCTIMGGSLKKRTLSMFKGTQGYLFTSTWFETHGYKWNTLFFLCVHKIVILLPEHSFSSMLSPSPQVLFFFFFFFFFFFRVCVCVCVGLPSFLSLVCFLCCNIVMEIITYWCPFWLAS